MNSILYWAQSKIFVQITYLQYCIIIFHNFHWNLAASTWIQIKNIFLILNFLFFSLWYFFCVSEKVLCHFAKYTSFICYALLHFLRLWFSSANRSRANSIFYYFFITKKSIAQLTQAIVDLVCLNSAIDSKKIEIFYWPIQFSEAQYANSKCCLPLIFW